MTEKTNDLIAEARQAVLTMDYALAYQGGLVGRLADALEAAIRVPVQGELVRQESAKLVAVRDILNRDDFGDDWEHDEWVYRQAAERKLADIEEALGSVMLAVPDAIARVRELHRESEAYRETCVECSVGENLIDWPCRTIQALDGAPEPEWEWGYRGETLIDVHERKSRESAEGAVKDLTEYWAAQGKKFEVVRRRKAGPWLPVEGEKP